MKKAMGPSYLYGTPQGYFLSKILLYIYTHIHRWIKSVKNSLKHESPYTEKLKMYQNAHNG